jgi:RNA polymerase-binding protein DksA
MKKNETKKAKTPASKPAVKTVAKASPAKPTVKTAAKKAAPAKKATPAKKVVAKAVPAKKATVKVAATKKAAPAKKAPVKAASAKKTTPAEKAPVKAVAAKKAAPAKKAPVKAAPAKKTTPAKKVAVKVEAKKVAPVKKISPTAATSAKKKLDKNKDVQASHHGRIITKAELKAFQNQAEANGHIIKKTYLSTKLKKHYREMLLKLRESYQDQLNIHRDDALTNRKSGPGAGMATHMADLGSDNFQHDFELGLLSDEGTVIEMIDEALTRLDENEYGICIECGQEISPARLEVKPYARFCLECKSRKEAYEGRHR